MDDIACVELLSEIRRLSGVPIEVLQICLVFCIVVSKWPTV
jgi:hypothetical protein